MKDKKDFFTTLREIDGQHLSETVRLAGDYDFSRYILKCYASDHEGSYETGTFAVRVPQDIAGFPLELFQSPVRRTALEDYLTRRAAATVRSLAHREGGVGVPARLLVVEPSQAILPRSSVIATDEYTELRLQVRWPVHAGRLCSAPAESLFYDDLREVVNRALIYPNLCEAEVDMFVEAMETAHAVRLRLPELGAVAFVAEGSTAWEGEAPSNLRASPALRIDPALRSRVEVDETRALEGLMVPVGLTLVLGSRASGRVAFLRSLADGVYNHVPGDGRERIVTVPDAVYVRALARRSIQRVDVSAFLPGAHDGCSSAAYSTDRADSCMAQAASIMEAIEAGARVLIMDESDSCSELLGADARLRAALGEQALAGYSLADWARFLCHEMGLSLVIGGQSAVSPMIASADRILAFDGTTVRDVTEACKKAFKSDAPPRTLPSREAFMSLNREVLPCSIDPSDGRFDVRIRAAAKDVLEFGGDRLNLSDLVQLSDVCQTRAIGLIFDYMHRRYLDRSRGVSELLDLVDRDLSGEGLETLSRDLRGDLARPRRYEIAMALNRLPSLRIAPPTRRS